MEKVFLYNYFKVCTLYCIILVVRCRSTECLGSFLWGKMSYTLTRDYSYVHSDPEIVADGLKSSVLRQSRWPSTFWVKTLIFVKGKVLPYLIKVYEFITAPKQSLFWKWRQISKNGLQEVRTFMTDLNNKWVKLISLCRSAYSIMWRWTDRSPSIHVSVIISRQRSVDSIIIDSDRDPALKH